MTSSPDTSSERLKVAAESVLTSAKNCPSSGIGDRTHQER